MPVSCAVLRRKFLAVFYQLSNISGVAMELTAGVTTELNGAELTIRCLQEEGVEFLFGYPGGAVLPLYDELSKQDKVKHILVRHEQAAVHAADAYARSTDKI